MAIIEEFGINPYLLLAQMVNFAILLFLLKLFLYKPILKVLEERKVKIAKSLENAEEIEKKLAETASSQEKLLEKARSEASILVNEAKQQSKELAEKTMLETKATIEDLMKRTDERLKLEKEQMMVEVKKDLADLVIAATTKVTGQTMDSESNRKLVKETVKEFGEK